MRIENAIVLVTCANRGIGLTFARELLSRGARKVYAGARDPTTVPSGCSSPAARRDQARRCGGRRATGVRCDPRDQQRRHLSTGGFLAPDSEGVARRLFETNFFAMLRMSQAFAPVLKSNGGGALLNVLSIASWMNGGELAAYAASKSAAWSLTNALRNELAVQKTQVLGLGLHMAYVDTNLTRGLNASKSSPEQIVQRALDGLEWGLDEVLADELTQ